MAFLLRSSKQVVDRSHALKSSVYTFSTTTIPYPHKSSPPTDLPIISFSDFSIACSDAFTCMKWCAITKASRKLMSGKEQLLKTTMPSFLMPSNSSLHPEKALKALMNMHFYETMVATNLKAKYLDTSLRDSITGDLIQKMAATLFNATENRSSSSDKEVLDLMKRRSNEIKAATLSKAAKITISSPHPDEALRDLINRHCIEMTTTTMLEHCYAEATKSSDPETALKELMVELCTMGYDSKSVCLERTNFRFELDKKEAFNVIVNMPGIEKQDTMVYVCDKFLVLIANAKSASDQVVRVMKIPALIFNPKEVTGRIIEGGELKISFPSEKE